MLLLNQVLCGGPIHSLLRRECVFRCVNVLVVCLRVCGPELFLWQGESRRGVSTSCRLIGSRVSHLPPLCSYFAILYPPSNFREVPSVGLLAFAVSVVFSTLRLHVRAPHRVIVRRVDTAVIHQTSRVVPGSVRGSSMYRESQCWLASVGTYVRATRWHVASIVGVESIPSRLRAGCPVCGGRA